MQCCLWRLLQHMEYIDAPFVLSLGPYLASMHNFRQGISSAGYLNVLGESASGPVALTWLGSLLSLNIMHSCSIVRDSCRR
jgi:hypothetical protein